jgi:hypothetical protein
MKLRAARGLLCVRVRAANRAKSGIRVIWFAQNGYSVDSALPFGMQCGSGLEVRA